jgi:hypothetical protein
MSTDSFQTINDRQYDFVEEFKLRNEILKSGRKKIVFVEGYDDKIIFQIIFDEHLEHISFIDVSLAKSITGGCQIVEGLLENFVSNRPEDKRFYGVVDRDLRMDEEIELKISQPCYDKRLFIFTERYTIENYYITVEILHEFIKGLSLNHRKLISLAENKNEFEQKILKPVESILVDIAAANLTIRYFDKTKSFLKYSVPSDQIENHIFQELGSNHDKYSVIEKLIDYKNFILLSENNTHKFASAKLYISYNFNKKINDHCSVSIQINNHKSELARILKGKGLPDDFIKLLSLLNPSSFDSTH